MACRFRRRVARVSQHLNDLNSTIVAIEERQRILMPAMKHFCGGRRRQRSLLETQRKEAEEQMRTGQTKLECTQRVRRPTRERAGPSALAKESCVLHQTAAGLRV